MDFGDSDPDGMCPNCTTPWGCNGPHLNNLRDWVRYTVHLTKGHSTNDIIDGLILIAQEEEVVATREEIVGVLMQLMVEGQVIWDDTHSVFRSEPAWMTV